MKKLISVCLFIFIIAGSSVCAFPWRELFCGCFINLFSRTNSSAGNEFVSWAKRSGSKKAVVVNGKRCIKPTDLALVIREFAAKRNIELTDGDLQALINSGRVEYTNVSDKPCKPNYVYKIN